MLASTTYIPAEAKALPHQGGIGSRPKMTQAHSTVKAASQLSSCQGLLTLQPHFSDSSAALWLQLACTLNFLLPLVSAAS